MSGCSSNWFCVACIDLIDGQNHVSRAGARPFKRSARCRVQPSPLSIVQGVQVDEFIPERPLQSFDHPFVCPAALAVHADLDLCIRQHVDPAAAGELRSSIDIEYLRHAIFCQGLFQCFNSNASTQNPAYLLWCSPALGERCRHVLDHSPLPCADVVRMLAILLQQFLQRHFLADRF